AQTKPVRGSPGRRFGGVAASPHHARVWRTLPGFARPISKGVGQEGCHGRASLLADLTKRGNFGRQRYQTRGLFLQEVGTVSGEMQVPVRELERWRRILLEGGTIGSNGGRRQGRSATSSGCRPTSASWR